MRKLNFIDIPNPISKFDYEKTISKLIECLSSHRQIKLIYQMGSIKDPGISDLDIICIFSNDSSCEINFREKLNLNEKRILTHSLFGIETKNFELAQTYNLISNLKLHYGDNPLKTGIIPLNKNIRTQIALEYLLRMYMSLNEQITYGIVKLRSFLLLSKAIKFDLELLNIDTGKLYCLVNEVIKLRSIWFKDGPSNYEINLLVLNFHKELQNTLNNLLNQYDFYLPDESVIFPEGYVVYKSGKFKVKYKGFTLPKKLYFFGRKYMNIQRKFNSFKFEVPYKIPEPNSDISERFNFGEKLYKTNFKKFPHFLPLNSSLSIY